MDSKRPISCDKIVLIGHNSATFDTPILLRTLQDYSTELLQRMNKLNVHFADSLVLFRNLIKDKHEALEQDDGSFVKTNQGSLYKHLFGTDFQCHDALEDEKVLNRILPALVNFHNCQQMRHNGTKLGHRRNELPR